MSALSQKNRPESWALRKKNGGEGYLSNFPKNNVGNLKVWEEVKKEIHKQKLRRVGHLSKKNKRENLSNFPAKM